MKIWSEGEGKKKQSSEHDDSSVQSLFARDMKVSEYSLAFEWVVGGHRTNQNFVYFKNDNMTTIDRNFFPWKIFSQKLSVMRSLQIFMHIRQILAEVELNSAFKSMVTPPFTNMKLNIFPSDYIRI